MKNKNIIYPLFKATIYFIFLGLILWYIYNSPYNPHPHSAEDVRNWVAGFGAMAPLIYLGIYTIRPLLLFPTLLLNLSAGVLFGPWLGILMVLAGGFGCASFCYLLGRFGGGRWFLKHFGGSWGAKLEAYLVGDDSFTKMLWLRTVPIFPYDPVSVIAGSVKMSYKTYAAATLCGMLPGAIAYNFLADSFGTSKFYLAILVTIMAFGIPWIWWKHSSDRKKLLAQKEQEE